jgi:FdhD protein
MKRFDLAKPAVTYLCFVHEDAHLRRRSRALPQETPVALVYDGSTEAVMMATPADLEDFAVGFSVTEGLISNTGEISDVAVAHSESGIELRMWLAGERGAAYRRRRRRLAGPTGCGLCGIESLTEAQRSLPRACAGVRLHASEVIMAVNRLMDFQELRRETHATHAAGFYQPCGAMVVREDVGRHNALDKLAGALYRAGTDATGGAIVISSRVSVEMVQKAAMMGAGLLIAVSAPTALAIRTAEAANVTLVALARGQSFEVFSHPQRLSCSGPFMCHDEGND